MIFDANGKSERDASGGRKWSCARTPSPPRLPPLRRHTLIRPLEAEAPTAQVIQHGKTGTDSEGVSRKSEDHHGLREFELMGSCLDVVTSLAAG